MSRMALPGPRVRNQTALLRSAMRLLVPCYLFPYCLRVSCYIAGTALEYWHESTTVPAHMLISYCADQYRDGTALVPRGGRAAAEADVLREPFLE
eukprot:311843-Rhodomonas_salina.1